MKFLMQKSACVPAATVWGVVLVVGVFSSNVTSAYAASVDKLLPHRAIYDLSLLDASERSGIRGMSGRIVYEMVGSKCEGFAVRFRFLTQVQTSRKNFTNDQRTTSFESGDGTTFSFVNQAYLNGQLESELRGKAKLENGATKIDLSKPVEESIELGSSMFMTSHIAAIIDAAKKQETILEAKIYDGSDNGDEILDTTTIIGKRKAETLDVDGEDKKLSTKFKGEQNWPVTVSYFSTTNIAGGGEKLPVYTVSFLMHESGVSRRLKMQYEDYALKGDLKQIDYLPIQKCE